MTLCREGLQMVPQPALQCTSTTADSPAAVCCKPQQQPSADGPATFFCRPAQQPPACRTSSNGSSSSSSSGTSSPTTSSQQQQQQQQEHCVANPITASSSSRTDLEHCSSVPDIVSEDESNCFEDEGWATSSDAGSSDTFSEVGDPASTEVSASGVSPDSCCYQDEVLFCLRS